MAKAPSLTTISSGYYSSTALTSNFDAISTAFENTLSLDGSTPNAMAADIDLNDNDLLNVGTMDASSITLAGTALTTANLAQVAPWEWRDAWVTATEYSVNDLVRQDGNVYICVTAHTAGTFATDLSGGLWNLFASKGTSGAGSGDLLAANNLDDLDSAATARTNLGLRIGVEVQAYNSDLDGKGVTGSDTDVVTGTAGTNGNLATWNSDGDLVDGPAYGESGASKLLQLTSGGEIPSALLPSTDAYRTLLQTEVASSASEVIIDGFDNATYSTYELEFDDVHAEGIAHRIYMRTSTDGGMTFDGGGADYSHNHITGTGSLMALTATGAVGDSTVGGCCATVRIIGAAETKFTKFYSTGLMYMSSSGNDVEIDTFGGTRRSATDVDALRIYMSVGSVTGTIRLYGVSN